MPDERCNYGLDLSFILRRVKRDVRPPLDTIREILTWSTDVKKVIAFSKKWFATCMTPDACWLAMSWILGCEKSRAMADLHDSNIRTLLHLKGGIHKAIFRDPSIGIDKQDDLSTRTSACWRLQI